MEEITHSKFRFNENQKIKIYQFIASTEKKIDDTQLLVFLDKWRQIIQNAQQPKQLRDLYIHKIEPTYNTLELTNNDIIKRFSYLKKLTIELYT